MKSSKTTVGRTEDILLPQVSSEEIVARIDTGAQTSSISVSRVRLVDNILEVVFLHQKDKGYTGKIHKFKGYKKTTVTSSNGTKQDRYKIKLRVIIKGRLIRASFTLTDRSSQTYPVLIGRTVLRGKFIVDVEKGDILKENEAKRIRRHREKIAKDIIT